MAKIFGKCKKCNKEFTRIVSKTNLLKPKYCSKVCQYSDRKNIGLGGWKNSEEWKKNKSDNMALYYTKNKMPCGESARNWQGGLPHCLDCGKELSKKGYIYCNQCSSKGERNAAWKGGVSRLDDSIRGLELYYSWRKHVFQRDNYICQACNVNGRGDLNAHHKVHLAKIIKDYNIKTQEDARACELLWDINNGITLCQNCHKVIHNKRK